MRDLTASSAQVVGTPPAFTTVRTPSVLAQAHLLEPTRPRHETFRPPPACRVERQADPTMKKVVDELQILEQNRRFHDEVEADHYDQRMGVSHDDASCAKIVDELERVLGGLLPRTGRLIDVASGTGNLAIKLARTGSYDEVVAVDISIRSLEVARRSAAQVGREITIVQSDMKRLPFEDNSFDVLVGCAFLHHLAFPVEFMSEVRRVLKPGCPFVIIGEGTRFFARALPLVKGPMLLANRCVKALRKSDAATYKWEHDAIDVHDFTMADAEQLVAGFDDARIVTEGFAGPLIEQGLLAPIRYFLPSTRGVIGGVLNASERVMMASDRVLFNRMVPRAMRTTLKISGRKPRLA
jgi:2-polyprenyl-3-methyl-5-hydroxy-6-metoxy-1,4-benzoquinol methylase